MMNEKTIKRSLREIKSELKTLNQFLRLFVGRYMLRTGEGEEELLNNEPQPDDKPEPFWRHYIN